MTDLDTIAARYGVQYSGELVGPDYHDQIDHSQGDWSLADVARAKGKITRVRILKDPGYNAPCDVSYIHATLPDGRIVPVRCPVGHGRYGDVVTRFLAWARNEKVYAKRLGLLDRANWSVMS